MTKIEALTAQILQTNEPVKREQLVKELVEAVAAASPSLDLR